MKALQYRNFGAPPEVVELPTPEPGPGQVRLKVTAAGACHSDDFIMSLPPEQYSFGLPLTLGHEGTGIVDKLGEGVTGISIGAGYAIYGPWGCGVCYRCAQGHENYCENAKGLGIRPPGLGAPGCMAEYVIVANPRHLVPLNGLDPVANVALTDAGLTPYHAVKHSLSKLPPGSTAVVIGAGGLGHVAIQVLGAITPATVVALDVDDEKLQLAEDVGAHHVFRSDASSIGKVQDVTGGKGANAVFDFVGMQATLDQGQAMIAMGGDQVIVGVGSGHLPVGYLDRPHSSTTRSPYWGHRSELFEILELSRSGAVHVETEVFSLEEAPEAYRRLKAGTLRGRAVIVP